MLDNRDLTDLGPDEFSITWVALLLSPTGKSFRQLSPLQMLEIWYDLSSLALDYGSYFVDPYTRVPFTHTYV